MNLVLEHNHHPPYGTSEGTPPLNIISSRNCGGHNRTSDYMTFRYLLDAVLTIRTFPGLFILCFRTFLTFLRVFLMSDLLRILRIAVYIPQA